MNSLLPDVDLIEAMKTHSDGQRTAATEHYTTQVGRAHTALNRLAHKAAAQHDDPVDATNAAANLLERFSDSVEGNGDAIVSNLAQQRASVNQAPAPELEATQRELEATQQELDRVNGVQVELRESAREASNLRGHLDQANADKTRLQQELDQARAQIRDLEQNTGQPNPLSQRVEELTAETTRLKRELEQANADKSSAQQRLDELERQVDEARQQPEPDSQSGDESEEPEHRPGLLDRFRNPRRAGRD